MQPYEIARQRIINDLDLSLTAHEDKALELTLRWLFNKGSAKAIIAMEKLEQKGALKTMTEKEVLEIRIKHLEARKRLMTTEINFRLMRLREALSLQKGFKVGGKYGFKFEAFEDED